MKRICEGTLILIGLALPLAACASNKARPDTSVPASGHVQPGDRPRAQPGTTGREDVRSDTTGSIHIDDRITKACGNLPVPHFAFDSAEIKDEAADRLQIVARCFESGPLKGHTLRLVGRADPRGTSVYNLALGQDRATSVARYLESAGLSRTQIQSMSRGDLDATGVDEEGWERDRRVDLVLGD